MGELKFSSRFDDWSRLGDESFESAGWRDAQPDQLCVFADQTKDGSIEADITPVEGKKGASGLYYKEGGFLLRYASIGQGYQGYCAGLGSFGTKFSICRCDGSNFRLLASTGQSDSIVYGKTYRIQVKCVGSQIKLHDNGVLLLTAIDETYSSGQFGLRTFKTNARFERIRITKNEPLCFVVMPFSSDMGFIYQAIQEVVKQRGLRCVRGDERFVSRPVIDELKEDIARADLVIVDFTNRNPNVYYEAGLADALKKKWIVIAQSPDDLTFDVKHIRTIIYSDRMGADISFREQLDSAIKATIQFTKPQAD
jgi:hypothetical protein